MRPALGTSRRDRSQGSNSKHVRLTVPAAFGWLNPLLAAFIHVSSEFAFILNSAGLLPAASK
jgi:hypothetical protein